LDPQFLLCYLVFKDQGFRYMRQKWNYIETAF